jgi:molybdopterin-guanine dinucleotide biosynthesis protein A
MGRDKALIVIDGEPMVQRVARALELAGAASVIVVGGDRARFHSMGLDTVADLHPGEGPLGGVLTALRSADAAVVAVLATDIVSPDPAAIRTLRRALGPHDVAVPVSGGRRHFHHAVWHVRAQALLGDAFAAGERALKRAVRDLEVAEVYDLDDTALADADTPDELPGDDAPRAVR